MRIDQVAIALAVANLALIALLAGWHGTTRAEATPQPVQRARRIELVDAQGVLRAQLRTEPDGEVVFRLRDRNGDIRVKLAAGLVLLDDRTEVGVHILSGISARTGQRNTTIALATPDGATRVMRPDAPGAAR